MIDDMGVAAADRDIELVSLAERPDVRRAMEEAEAAIYPAFMVDGQDFYYEQMGRLGDSILPFQIAYVDRATGEVLAGAEATPIAWDGTDADLPHGFDDGLRRAVAVAEGRAEPTALCAANLMVSEEARGLRLSTRLAADLCERDPRFPVVVAAIRGALKHEHPGVAMEHYVQWRRDDGRPFDPMIRSFLDAGARLGPVTPDSLTITGTVAQWSGWTGMEFPADGAYEIPGGLAHLTIDRARDLGTYVEPSVWIVLERSGT